MTVKKTVIIISDDYFYLNGLEFLLKNDNHLNVFCHYVYQNQKKCFSDSISYDIHNEKSIIILAVDDLDLIRKFAACFSTNVIYSLRTLGKREMVLYYKGALVINRCLSIWRMLDVIKKYGRVNFMPGISLTQKEEQVIFSYFNLTGTHFNAFKYKTGIKKISHYKRSAYQKMLVNGDGEAHFVVKALSEIRTGVL
ncbi:hypothetical protein O7047_02840 [Pseudenterobacter timonensis]|uniref:Uncharacterized protein n=1 Tax=Pseudenterobacter timonensis TaxID=1755099 RepID=A0AAE4DK02_9ENTR|nr:hypothetical protein [Pseudenterobacter timonensis]MDR9889170.1 hypothetical protein [Pseudenterobacter timonensis]